MRILIIVFLASSALLRCDGGPIDFTPIRGQRELEGMTFPQIQFHQDGHVISYEQPRAWTCTGNASQLKLTPPMTSQVQASIDQVPLSNPQIFDPATTSQLRQLVLTSLPADAQKAEVVGEEQSPVRINQQETYAVTVSYGYFGQEYQRSVLFANLGDIQLRFRLTARKVDFDAMQRAFRASLFSLHWE